MQPKVFKTLMVQFSEMILYLYDLESIINYLMSLSDSNRFVNDKQ